jgi:hypothetical protein
MFQGFAAVACGGDQNRQVLFDLVLPDEIVQADGAQGGIDNLFRTRGGVDQTVGGRAGGLGGVVHTFDYT